MMQTMRLLSIAHRPLIFARQPANLVAGRFRNKRVFSSSISQSISKKPVISAVLAASVLGTGVIAFTPSLRSKFFSSHNSKSEQGSDGVARSTLDGRASNHSSDPIPHLPEEIAYLLVGGGSASFGATRAIRVNDPKSKIIIITDEKEKPYLRPPLSKEIWLTPPEVSSKLYFRQYNGTDKDIHYEHEEFYQSLEQLAVKETGGVAVVHGVTVTKLDTDANVAHLSSGQQIKYGKCLLATGGEAVKVECFERLPQKVRQEQVIYYRNLNDFKQLSTIFEDKNNKGKVIAIIGGQFGGSELAAVLARRSHFGAYDISITQIVEESGVLSSILPEYLSKFVTLKVVKENARVLTNSRITGASVESAENGSNRIKLLLSDGNNVTADFVVVTDPKLSPANGDIELVDKNAPLADASHLEVDRQIGGFVANSELQVKSNVYTAGDCASYFDYVTKERRRGGHHDFAIASGRHAGQNMTGKSLNFKYIPFFWSDIGPDVSIEAVGDIDSSHETTGIFLSSPISSLSLPGEEVQNDSTRQAPEKLDGDRQSTADNALDAARVEPSGAIKTPETEYERGVVFYHKKGTLVGILMINLFNKVHLSRRILQDRALTQSSDPSEIAKLYHMYSVED